MVRDPQTYYFPDPANPMSFVLNHVLLSLVYGLPASWALMPVAIPIYALALRYRLAVWWIAAGVGAGFGGLAGSFIVKGMPPRVFVLYGAAVGVTFFLAESRFRRRVAGSAA